MSHNTGIRCTSMAAERPRAGIMSVPDGDVVECPRGKYTVGLVAAAKRLAETPDSRRAALPARRACWRKVADGAAAALGGVA